MAPLTEKSPHAQLLENFELQMDHFESRNGKILQRFRLLVKYFGSAKKAWQANGKDLLEIGFNEKLVNGYLKFKREFDLDKNLNLIKEKNLELITLEDKDYPKRLKDIDDPPFILYTRKNASCKKSLAEIVELSIAVVGARKMTSYGREVVERLAGGLVNKGITIISGLALGIDAMAHKVCLERGGLTVVVLGNGLDQIYPPANKGLGEAMVSSGQGMLVSEYPLGYPAMPQNFPIRNRIVSGISLGVLVIEGAEKSGTFLTASAAAAQGREVFAVPGPITSLMSKAPNYLIKNGAKLAESAQDILEELNIESRIVKSQAKQVLPETDTEKKLLELITTDEFDIDSLVRISGMDTSRVLSALTTMELKGMVKNAGGIYIKYER